MKEISKLEKTESRIERKFFIPNKLPQEIEAIIMCNSALFKEIFKQRRVNNIYFDTFKRNSFWQNIEGDPKKKKYRIRWYDIQNGDIQKPVLEYKIKDGIAGKKYSIPIRPFDISSNSWYQNIVNSISKSDLSYSLFKEIDTLEPTLFNFYDRKYFLSKDKKFRLTLDTNMNYFNVLKKVKSFCGVGLTLKIPF